MKILIINQYAGTPDLGMEFRPYHLASDLVARGHEVTIIAASFTHMRQSVTLEKGEPKIEYIDGVRYIWVPSLEYSGNGLKRARGILTFLKGCKSVLRKELCNYSPDFVFASSTHPFDISIANWMKRNRGSSIVFEVHDLWPLSLSEIGGMSKAHPFYRICHFYEGLAYRKSDIVISLLPHTKNYMVSRGMKERKFHYLPNGVKSNDWVLNPDSEASKSMIEIRERNSGKSIVGYAGAVGIANELTILLHLAERFKSEICVVVAGDGPELTKLVDITKERKLKNVFFLGRIEKREIPTFLSYLDIAYVGLKPTPLFKFGISPNKLFDYMMAAKPIFMCIDSARNPVSQAQCGFICQSDDIKEISSEFSTFLEIPKSEKVDMGKRGYEYVIQNHEYASLGKRLESILIKNLN